MNRIDRTITFASGLALALALAACAEPSEPGAPGDPLDDAAPTGQIVAIDATAVHPTRQPLADRVEPISALLLDGAPATYRPAIPPSLAPAMALEAARAAAQPSVRVSSDPATGELLLVNGPVADDHAVGADIGEDAARRVFEQAVARLDHAGVEDVRGLDLTRVEVSRLMMATMRVDDPDSLDAHVRAYVFTAPRTIHGVALHRSEVTIGVHHTGALASFHSRGPVVDAGVLAAQRVAPRDRTVSPAELGLRIAREHPDMDAHPLGLEYVAGAGADGALEPRAVFALFPERGAGTGTRGRLVAYSVTDAAAAAEPLDHRLVDDPGDRR